jgi:DNA (cytosine-5)-methyltransferase 1
MRDRLRKETSSTIQEMLQRHHISAANIPVIPNHVAANLSELDMRMVVSVPEGGNWKHIPESIPSKRLDQIRESFSRGEGSRSTYYGRLRRSEPAYTINTYFNRPGNGCHIHYSQDRVLSPREAARLQSFPDSFQFYGSHTSVSTQIGNAVPPLLAYQIARTLGPPGVFVDLFSGAGGMGLGFKWAGWHPLVANDIQPAFLTTYARNVHENVLLGSISDNQIIDELVIQARRARSDGRPFWVLGGPPCQGFSTAGNQRSMDDPRNHLAWDYVQLLEATRPDGFVFENVMGLLNMEGGRVFASMCEAFSNVMSTVVAAALSADCYAIPQRRKRVILVGSSQRYQPWVPPIPVTAPGGVTAPISDLPRAISVQEALEDLPPLSAGQNGTLLSYIGTPKSSYQALMRGFISAQEYLDTLSERVVQ